MSETSNLEKVWNWVKLVSALGCVCVFCNGMLIKGKQGAELASNLKTMFENTNRHTADVNDVIAWASKGR